MRRLLDWIDQMPARRYWSLMAVLVIVAALMTWQAIARHRLEAELERCSAYPISVDGTCNDECARCWEHWLDHGGREWIRARLPESR